VKFFELCSNFYMNFFKILAKMAAFLMSRLCLSLSFLLVQCAHIADMEMMAIKEVQSQKINEKAI